MTTALQLDLSTHFTTIIHLLLSASSPTISTPLSALSPAVITTLALMTQSPRDSLTSLLRTYVSLGLTSIAEEKIRNEWVKPWCARMIRKDSFLASQQRTRRRKGGLKARDRTLAAPKAEGDEGEQITEDSVEEVLELECLFENLLDFMEDSKGIGLLLEVAESASHRSRHSATSNTQVLQPLFVSTETSRKYHILSNVVWDEMGRRVCSELSSVIFAAGQPDLFHRVSAVLHRYRLPC